MKELFYKQFKLVAHPMTFAFLLCGVMLLIPNYPYTVGFFYVTLGIFFMFLNAREQRDNDFSALLPIRKRDTVKCTVLFVTLIEVLSVAVSALFVALAGDIAPNRDNLAGTDANLAVLGLGFFVFAVFNGIFLPAFYKTGYKVGASFFKASVGVFLVVGLDVALPHILPFFDGQDIRQLYVLAGGAAIFALVTVLAYRRSATLFERVDL